MSVPARSSRVSRRRKSADVPSFQTQERERRWRVDEQEYASIEGSNEALANYVQVATKHFKDSHNKRKVQWGGITLYAPEQLFDAFSLNTQFEAMKALSEDWDGEGSEAPSKELLRPAFAFLWTCAIETFKLGINRPILRTPVISLCADGSVDMSWRSTSTSLLINVRMKNGQLRAYYYGETPDGTPFGEAWVYADRALPEQFVVWLKNVSH